MAACLNMDPGDVLRLCTVPGDNSSETLLKQDNDACIFLDSGLCMVYEARPGACSQFPAIALHANLLGNRMSSVCRQAAICPVVFQALDEFKRLTGFRPKHRSPGAGVS
jgi:Fe-S-cluster containining protein